MFFFILFIFVAMWKCLLLFLFLSQPLFTRAAPDSLLYPKAQLNAFKDRVAVAKKYADTTTVLFRSVAQSTAVYFDLSGAQVSELVKQISLGESPTKVFSLLKGTDLADTVLLLRRVSLDAFAKNDSGYIAFRPNNFSTSENEMNTKNFKVALIKGDFGKWLYKKAPKNIYYGPFLFAFYLPQEIKSVKLPLRYSRAVHYLQQLAGRKSPTCFIPHKAEYTPTPENPFAQAFKNYTDAIAPPPEYISGLPAEEHEKFVAQYKLWKTDRWKLLDSAYAVDPLFKKKMEKAVTESFKTLNPWNDLPAFVAHYGDARKGLLLNCIRFNYPVGCGNDFHARLQFLETARFAAAAHDWFTFLWAHLYLGITDDAQSGKEPQLYGWDNRIAYTRELEYLGIDVPQLLLGLILNEEATTLRDRLNYREAIYSHWAESSEPKRIKEVFVSAAIDTNLDLFNRTKCYWILWKQFRYESSSSSKSENTKTLEKVAATLPHWATTQIED